MTIMEDAQELQDVRAMGKDYLTPGMRNFDSWLRGPLPRSCSPTDIDFCLHNGADDTFLWIEFKPPEFQFNPKKPGQLRLLQALAAGKGNVVLVVFDPENGRDAQDKATMPLDDEFEYLVVRPNGIDFSPTYGRRTATIGQLNYLCHQFMVGQIPAEFR